MIVARLGLQARCSALEWLFPQFGTMCDRIYHVFFMCALMEAVCDEAVVRGQPGV
jgi:hypothetical protein